MVEDRQAIARGSSREPVSQRSRGSYIAGIDGLRAAAVLSVLIYHIDEHRLPGGFVGVDLFFVISGFVVSMATSGIEAPTFARLFAAFYRRRVIRILPAALFFLLMMQLIAVLFVPSADSLGVADMTVAASAAGVGNLVLWQMAGDYFSPGVVLNPFTHMWSLGVEEQFYVLFPIFAAGIFIWRANSPARHLSVIALTLLAAVSLGLAALYTHTHQTFVFYMLPARLWELAAGVLLFAAIGARGAIRKFNSPKLPAIGVMGFFGMAVLVGSFVWVSPASFPFPGAIPPIIGAVLVIASYLAHDQTSKRRKVSHGTEQEQRPERRYRLWIHTCRMRNVCGRAAAICSGGLPCVGVPASFRDYGALSGHCGNSLYGRGLSSCSRHRCRSASDGRSMLGFHQAIAGRY